jgi:hypothetical protein
MSVILITEQQTIPGTRLRHSRAVLHWLTYARHRLADTCKALTACLSAFRQHRSSDSQPDRNERFRHWGCGFSLDEAGRNGPEICVARIEKVTVAAVNGQCGSCGFGMITCSP